MLVLTYIFINSGKLSSTLLQRKQANGVAFLLLGGFSFARYYSYRIDGAPEIDFSFNIWYAEIIGSFIALFYHIKHKKEESKLKLF
jgi:hypothetical protein